MRRLLVLSVLFLAGCSIAPQRAPLEPIAWPDDSGAAQLAVLNRVTWGATRSSLQQISQAGTGRWLDAQLRPAPTRLPREAQATIDAMTVSHLERVTMTLEELEQKIKG